MKRTLLISALVAAVLAVLALRVNFSEDIVDFLPQNKEYTESMEVFSGLNEAGRIVVIFQGGCADSICAAIDSFSAHYPQARSSVDFEKVAERLDFVYTHIPYFLTEMDYERLGRILNKDSIGVIVATDAEALTHSGGEYLAPVIEKDPLRLVSPERALSSKYSESKSAFTQYEGYILMSDGTMGFAFIDTGGGALESRSNALLIDSIDAAVDAVASLYPDVGIRLAGAPVVAVGNAKCIKKDSTTAIALSLLLITALLLYAFPKVKDIALIVISVGFGWLCGMAALSVAFESVSLIVMGIGSVLIGIAVNYPLHVLVHKRYTASVKQTMDEIAKPLVIGNITTVAAFASLIAIDSPALRQLGVFASTMLIGTILFCVLALPKFISAEPVQTRDIPLPHFGGKALKIAGVAAVVLAVAALIVPFATDRPLFDSNISNINYLTPQQRADFAYFESLSAVSDEPAYLVSGARAELTARVERWNAFWQGRDAEAIDSLLTSAAISSGFNPDAFSSFTVLISTTYTGVDLTDSGTLAALWPGRFDTAAFNSIIATSISDNFDFIGIVCSAVVFIFLCICFRSLFIGGVAFAPMAVSWVVIIAIMQLAAIQFNIVSVILAAFIFGQGDDYTIFIVEGLLYERRTGKQMLPQYRQSIVLSALIMLISMGVLSVSCHPAMHSLGVVTLIGMVTVVVMAIIIPPALFSIGGKIKFINKRL